MITDIYIQHQGEPRYDETLMVENEEMLILLAQLKMTLMTSKESVLGAASFGVDENRMLFDFSESFNKVSLENEINHLEDYISLEKLRFHDTLEVNLIKGDDISEMYIAPMLLIPFVENSFKHGAIIDGSLAIMIAVKRNSEMLFFEVENSVLEKTNDSTGIGLENIKKRLEMLYPNAYTLEINRTDKLFKVQLAININGLKTHKNVDES